MWKFAELWKELVQNFPHNPLQLFFYKWHKTIGQIAKIAGSFMIGCNLRAYLLILVKTTLDLDNQTRRQRLEWLGGFSKHSIQCNEKLIFTRSQIDVKLGLSRRTLRKVPNWIIWNSGRNWWSLLRRWLKKTRKSMQLCSISMFLLFQTPCMVNRALEAFRQDLTLLLKRGW